MYVQVRSAARLVWPTIEGASHSTYCVLMVGGQQRGCTHQVACTVSNSAAWNEVFTLPRKALEAAGGRCLLQVWGLVAGWVGWWWWWWWG